MELPRPLIDGESESFSRRKREAARRKQSPVGTSHKGHESAQGPSRDTADDGEQHKEDLEPQENTEGYADDCEAITESLREWISVELERDDRKKVAVLVVQVCIQLYSCPLQLLIPWPTPNCRSRV